MDGAPERRKLDQNVPRLIAVRRPTDFQPANGYRPPSAVAIRGLNPLRGGDGGAERDWTRPVKMSCDTAHELPPRETDKASEKLHAPV